MGATQGPGFTQLAKAGDLAAIDRSFWRLRGLDHCILEEARCASQEETRARKHVVFLKRVGSAFDNMWCRFDGRVSSALQTN
jgi:hypothetical protein